MINLSLKQFVNLSFGGLVGALAGPLFAEPVIKNVEGASIGGGALTISGQGFGEFGGRIIAWDDFEGHRVGTPVASVDSKLGIGWSTQYGYSGNGIAIDDQRSVSGTKSVKVDWGADGGSTIRAFGWAGQGPIDKIYISYRRFMEGNYNSAEKDNHKQFYLFGTNAEFPQFMPLIPAGQNGWSIYNNSGDASSRANGERGHNTLGLNYSNTKGLFQRWEWHLELNAPVSNYNGIVKGWVNGKLGWNINDYRHRYVDGYWDDFRLGHMARGIDSAKAWYDDVYSATTPARAELCLSDTWVECGSGKTLLVPDSDLWSPSRITVFLPSLERFNGQQVYIYVIDSLGTVNAQGFKLPQGNPPKPPEIQSVN